MTEESVEETERREFAESFHDKTLFNRWKAKYPSCETIDGVKLADREIRGDLPDGFRLTNCDFVKCAFDSTLSKRIFQNTKFEHCTFPGNSYHDAIFEKCSFRFDRSPGGINTPHLIGCSFSGNLTGVQFSSANLARAKFVDVNLRQAKFIRCNLKDSVFQFAQLDAETKFEFSKSTAHMTISRYALAFLDDWGGLSVGQRSKMNIVDDVARLQLAFSGIWFWLHLGAILLFAAPYLWFLFVHYWQALILPESPKSISLFEAFLRYVVNGGQRWRDGFHPNLVAISTTCLFLAWNVLRLLLLAKTKSLEHRQQVTGLPAEFGLMSWNQWKATLRKLQRRPVMDALSKSYWKDSIKIMRGAWAWTTVYYLVTHWFFIAAMFVSIFNLVMILQIRVPLTRQ